MLHLSVPHPEQDSADGAVSRCQQMAVGVIDSERAPTCHEGVANGEELDRTAGRLTCNRGS